MKKANLLLSAFALLSLSGCGGGARPVAAFADACGSVYNTSSPVQIGYYDNNGQFVNDDSGIPVDYALSEDSWYDLEKLNTFVSGLKNA